jgi:N-acetylneuraminate synthase/N,N'-diacetyllegionaminate synthase
VNHFDVAGRRIGKDEPVFIVAEAGTTANGDIDTARELICAARDAGADAIKFQMIGADFFMSRKDVMYTYATEEGIRSENMYAMFKKLEFSREQWAQIADSCLDAGIKWFATVDYIPGVTLAENLNMPAYKVSSWDTANFPLLGAIGRTGKPVFVDLGPVDIIGTIKLLRVLQDNPKTEVALLHCTHADEVSELNLNTIPYLQEMLGVTVGYSADERRLFPDIMAVALGASVLEKRITIDKSYLGHHHLKALEPFEFRDYVRTIRQVQSMLGKRKLEPSREDLQQRDLYYVSIVADKNIPAGAEITRDMLACKRPGSGIMPEYLDMIVGRTARRDIRQNEMIGWHDV